MEMKTIVIFERSGHEVEIIEGEVEGFRNKIYCPKINGIVVHGWVEKRERAENIAKWIIDNYKDKPVIEKPVCLLPWYHRFWVNSAIKSIDLLENIVLKIGKWFSNE